MQKWSEILEDMNSKQGGLAPSAKPILVNGAPIEASRVTQLPNNNKDYVVCISERKQELQFDTGKKVTLTYVFNTSHIVASIHSEHDQHINITEKLDAIIRANSFCDTYGYLASLGDSQLFALNQLKHKYNIPDLDYIDDPHRNVVDIVTADYILATQHPDEFIAIIASAGKEINSIVLNELIKTNALFGEVFLSGYFLKHLGKLGVSHIQYQLCKESLTDIIPIAVEFGKDPSIQEKTEQVFLYNALSNPDTEICANSYITQEMFREFQKGLQTFEVPAAKYASGIYKNRILCTTKADLLKLTGIKFNTYSYDLGAHIFTSLLSQVTIKFGSPQWIDALQAKCEAKNRGRSFIKLKDFKEVR